MSKPIIVVTGDLDGVFFEIFFKSIKKEKIYNPIILICSFKMFKSEAKRYNFNKQYELFDLKKIISVKLENKKINIINIDIGKFNIKKINSKIKNTYLKKSFDIAFQLIKKGISNKFINGPINKKSFLNKKFPGITEYISHAFKIKNVGMLIYNKKLSVCPVTTHLPIKMVAKKINKELIKKKINLVIEFFTKILKKEPNIAVTGLNPHCESILNFNEDIQILSPIIRNFSRKGVKIKGPFSADTLFTKNNRTKFNIIIGMYHDQVLTPLKTLYEFDAVNITMGLPFLRVSPDHGPNILMINKNKSNPTSLIQAIKFLDKK